MWSAYLFQTTTGQIGPRLHFESVDWKIDLNDTENINMRLSKSDLPAVNLNLWLSPWWAGVVLFWNRTPVVAGPIITRPNESLDSISIGCGGIRSVLAKRYLVQEFQNWDDLPTKGLLSWRGIGLGTHVKRVVEAAQQKPGGKLPISYPIPDEFVKIPADLPACTSEDGQDGPNPCYWDAKVQGNGQGDSVAIYGTQKVYPNPEANHERNYKGFNISNLNVDDVLKKLSEVADGPDIMFKPRLLQENVLTFDLWTGTEAQPRIYQKNTPVWDLTPAQGIVPTMDVVTTGTYQTDRVFAIGTGQDEGTVIKVAATDRMIQQGYPLLESTISYSNSEDSAVVTAHAKANLDANLGPLLEVQMTVRGDAGIQFGQFWPGDLVEVVTKGWISIPNGTTQMRLLSMSGDSSNNVKVSLQRDDRYT